MEEVERKLPPWRLASSDSVHAQSRIHLVQCWALGDKYDIPDFQDLAMLELLRLYENEHCTASAMAFAVKNTTPGSKLRMLMAREAVVLYLHEQKKTDDYEEALEAVGFGLEIVKEAQRRETNNYVLCTYIADEGCDAADGDDWHRFMVAGGPVQHWVHGYAQSFDEASRAKHGESSVY